MVCEMFVFIGLQLQLHKHHHRFKVPASWTPTVVTCLCWMLVSCCLAIAVWVIAWYIYESPPNHTRYLSPDPLLLVTSSSSRGSPQCIAFKRYCTCQHLLQYSIMSVMQTVFLYNRISSHLCKTLQLHLNACLFDITKKKKLWTPNCDHTTTIITITTTSSTTTQILQGLFCICECRLSATFVRHSIVWISLYFNHGKSRTLVSYLRRIGGYFFN